MGKEKDHDSCQDPFQTEVQAADFYGSIEKLPHAYHKQIGVVPGPNKPSCHTEKPDDFDYENHRKAQLMGTVEQMAFITVSRSISKVAVPLSEGIQTDPTQEQQSHRHDPCGDPFPCQQIVTGYAE